MGCSWGNMVEVRATTPRPAMTPLLAPNFLSQGEEVRRALPRGCQLPLLLMECCAVCAVITSMEVTAPHAQHAREHPRQGANKVALHHHPHLTLKRRSRNPFAMLGSSRRVGVLKTSPWPFCCPYRGPTLLAMGHGKSPIPSPLS